MNLDDAYRRIWEEKLKGQLPPDQQSIERVNQTSELWLHHFRDGRLTGPLLDVGCGSGAMLAKAARARIMAVGVDFNGPLLEWLKSEARKLGDKTTPLPWLIVAGDLNTDDLPDWRGKKGDPYGLVSREASPRDHDKVGFQIATCCDVIEHLIDPDHCLAEIHRVLAPGGHAYISTPNCAFWQRVEQLANGEMFRTSGDNVLRDGGHLSYWAPKDLEASLKRAGFSEVGIEYRNRLPAPRTVTNRGQWSNYAYMIAWAVKK